jgi:hypothetical protein
MGCFHRRPNSCFGARRRKSKPAPTPRTAKSPDIRIEFPSRGETYCRQAFGVYEYSRYPRTSVLAGQQCRKFLCEWPTLEEAQTWVQIEYGFTPSDVAGCGYQSPYVDHLPDDGGC